MYWLSVPEDAVDLLIFACLDFHKFVIFGTFCDVLISRIIDDSSAIIKIFFARF